MIKHILEAAAQGIADETSKPPFLYQLGPKEARKVLDDVQAAPIDMSKVDEKWITVPAEVGDVQVRIVKPVGVVGDLPTVLYVHGGGWILGNAGTHDRLVRELAVGVSAAVVFVEYDVPRRPNTRSRSNRPTPPPDGSPNTVSSKPSTRPGSRSPATRSAATWPPP